MSKINRKLIEEELISALEANALMNSAGSMVGVDINAKAKEVLDGLEDRIRVAIYQKHRIATLEGLLEEEDE